MDSKIEPGTPFYDTFIKTFKVYTSRMNYLMFQKEIKVKEAPLPEPYLSEDGSTLVTCTRMGNNNIPQYVLSGHSPTTNFTGSEEQFLEEKIFCMLPISDIVELENSKVEWYLTSMDDITEVGRTTSRYLEFITNNRDPHYDKIPSEDYTKLENLRTSMFRISRESQHPRFISPNSVRDFKLLETTEGAASVDRRNSFGVVRGNKESSGSSETFGFFDNTLEMLMKGDD